jgi:uncharacterized membrane protein SpoIIM required for sporulation
MLNSDPPASTSPAAFDDTVDAIVLAGPHGALTLAALATVAVIGMWVMFYLLVFLPRGPLQ